MESKELTYEKLMATFAEITKMMQETSLQFKETNRQFKETDRQFKETDRKIKEADEKFQREREKMSAELDRRFKETDKKINKVHGLFTSQWGKLVEAIVRPASLKLFRERGIDVSRVQENTVIERDGIKKAEYDAILTNGSEVVIIEVKTTLRKKDITYFTQKLHEVKSYFPEYENKKVYGAMACISSDREADLLAVKNGLFLIKSSGEGVVKISNSKDFKPKSF